MIDHREQLAAWIAANPDDYSKIRADVIADNALDPSKLPPKNTPRRLYLDTQICEAIRKHNGWPAGRLAMPADLPAPKIKPVPPPKLFHDPKALAAGDDR